MSINASRERNINNNNENENQNNVISNVRHDFKENLNSRLAYIDQKNAFSGKKLNFRERLMILRVFTLLENSKRPGYWDKTTNLCDVSKSTVQKILLEFDKNNSLVDDVEESRLQVKNVRFLFSARIKNEIIAYVRKRQAAQQQTFAKDVKSDVLDKYGIDLSIRSVRRVLNDLNLKCKMRTLENDVEPAWNEKMYVRKDRYNYIRIVQDARRANRTIVYTDQTFLYEHPTKNTITWHDPMQPFQKMKKGRRLNVQAAVTDSGNVLRDAACFFEHWQLHAEKYGKDRVTINEPGRAADVNDSSDPVMVEKCDKDDFKDFLEQYITKKQNENILFSDFFCAHTEYCINPKVMIFPIAISLLKEQCEQKGFKIEDDFIKNVKFKKKCN